MNLDRTIIDACSECVVACSHCAASCLGEPDPKPMAECIASTIDCAEACRLAVGFLARDSERSEAAMDLCRATCQACEDECGKHDMDHCRVCAEACRQCLSVLGSPSASSDMTGVEAAIKRST